LRQPGLLRFPQWLLPVVALVGLVTVQGAAVLVEAEEHLPMQTTFL
jgi:hypothetical protein